MKLIAPVRLYPTKDQYATLRQTLEVANTACNSARVAGISRKPIVAVNPSSFAVPADMRPTPMSTLRETLH